MVRRNALIIFNSENQVFLCVSHVYICLHANFTRKELTQIIFEKLQEEPFSLKK